VSSAAGFQLEDKKKSNNNVQSEQPNGSEKPLAKLLVVDDEPDIVKEVLKTNLQKNRFLVDAFSNPQEALRNFQSNSKDYWLILLDIRMPALSGIRLARKVKRLTLWSRFSL
jgi:CheY-like chemotaxis protein